MGKIILILVPVLIVYFVYKYKSLTRTVDRLNKILYSDKNPDGYIKECDKLLQKIQGKRDRDINLLQKSTGLFYAGRFDEVKHVLNNELKKIPANGQHLYYQALILSMLFGGETEEGHKLIEEAREPLMVFKRTEGNSKGIDFIFAVDDLYQGKYQERKEFFIDLCENGRNYYRQAMANYCLALIYKNENNIEGMNKCLQAAKELGENSFVEKLALKELEQN